LLTRIAEYAENVGSRLGLHHAGAAAADHADAQRAQRRAQRHTDGETDADAQRQEGVRRLSDAGIPVIALTADAMAEDRQRCLDAGMDDYLTKPLTPENLLAVLEKWLQCSARPASAESSRAPKPGLQALEPEQRAKERPKERPRVRGVSSEDTQHHPVFNQEDLLRRIGNNKELAARLAYIFLESTPGKIDDLRRALAGDDMEQAAREIHALCGSAANFGAQALLAVAKTMHNAALEKDRQRLQALVPSLDHEFQRLDKALLAMLEAQAV